MCSPLILLLGVLSITVQAQIAITICDNNGCNSNFVDSIPFYRTEAPLYADQDAYRANSGMVEEDFTAAMVEAHPEIDPGWKHFDTLSAMKFMGAAFADSGAGTSRNGAGVPTSDMVQCGVDWTKGGDISSVVVASGAAMMFTYQRDSTVYINKQQHAVYIPLSNGFKAGTNTACWALQATD